MNGTKIILLLSVIIFLCQFCFSCNEQPQNEYVSNEELLTLTPSDVVFVSRGGIWGKYIGGRLPFVYENIQGGIIDRHEYKYQDILEIINSDSIALIPASIDDWSTCQYEILSIIPADGYREAVCRGDYNDLQIPLVLAYEYQTEQVYAIMGEQTYLVNNPDELKEFLRPFLQDCYADQKIHWVSRNSFIRYDVPGCEGSYYCHMYDFRYEKFWCTDRELPDNFFTELTSYPADGVNNLREALRLLAESLGYEQFSAYLGYDELTGYWEVEIDETDSLYGAYVYFDENFRILYGSTYGPYVEGEGA